MQSKNDGPLETIRAYWDNASRSEHDAHGLRPTARDPFLQEVVEAAMEKWLFPSASLFDIGCGDGESTLRFARSSATALGADYIERYIDRATITASERNVVNASFTVADVMDLSQIIARHGQFDIVTSIRCLINLGTWDNQRRAIGNIAACVRPGGLYLASEGWQQGMDGLNLRRERAGLQPIRVVEYNRMMSRRRFEEEAQCHFNLVSFESVGLYLFVSRVLQPLFVAPDPARHDHYLNKIAARLQASSPGDDFLDCDYAGIYVLRRKF